MAKLADFPHSDRSPVGETRPGDTGRECFCPHGGLVAKTSLEFRQQVRDLLRGRLRMTAIMLSAVLAAHLVRFAFTRGEIFSVPDSQLAVYLAVTIIEAACAASLCRRCEFSLLKLRIIEVVMFVTPAVMLMHMQVELARTSDLSGAEAQGTQLLAFSVPWILLLMLYGLFIPNTWRRATAIVLLFALGPVATVVWARAGEAGVLQTLYDSGVFSFNLLQMVFACFIAVWGAHRFGTLRREAFDLKNVGVYTLVRRLGGGGMGDVFLAEHRLLKRPCAVKLIRKDRENDESTIARFQDEVQATARLTHPNTVEIYDYGITDNGMFFYVMEYLPGMSVQDLVERTGPLPAGRVIYLLRQVCAALSEAHREGLIHRDIKPGNIFAAERGGIHDFAKLLDFGLVKSTGDRDADIRHTLEGRVVGSPLYSAPETVMGDGVVDGRVDIYSLGATAYFLLTGRPVFSGTSAIEIVFAHARETPTAPSQYHDVPSDLEAVILRCLSKSPDDRYANADELAAALSECRDAIHWDVRSAAEWWREFNATNPADKTGTLDEYAVTAVATPALVSG